MPKELTVFYVIFFDSSLLYPYDCAPMLRDPLPEQVDVRKLVAKGAEIHAQHALADLERFVGLLASNEGVVAVDLQCFTDEDRIRKLKGQLQVDVRVICQRCMEPMTVTLSPEFELGIVWTEEQAKQLPRSIDPLIVGEEPINLIDVIEEELILSLPFVNYHDPAECTGRSHFESGDQVEVTEEVKENPFKVLEQLKSGK